MHCVAHYIEQKSVKTNSKSLSQRSVSTVSVRLFPPFQRSVCLQGFEKHVKQEHCQWAYLFFFIHLRNTRINDYSAIELYVHRQLLRDNINFFPLNRAMSLEVRWPCQTVFYRSQVTGMLLLSAVTVITYSEMSKHHRDTWNYINSLIDSSLV